MSLLSILGLVLPIVTKVVGVIFDRVWRHGYSTLAGTAAGAGVFAILQQSGCDMANFDKTLLAIIAALPGMLSTDAGKTSVSIPSAVAQVITQGQISTDNL